MAFSEHSHRHKISARTSTGNFPMAAMSFMTHALADDYISRGPTLVMPHGRKLDSEFRAIQAAITETDSLSNHSTAKHHVIELDDTKQKNVYITCVHVIAMR